MKRSIPPISNIFNDSINRTGTLGSFTLTQNLPKKNNRNIYLEISKLSTEYEKLKNENEILQQELYDSIMESRNPYCQMKKTLLEFSAKLTEREKEVEHIKKFLEQSKTTDPTFVEVSLNQDREASFDLVATSLLVSNEQRNFFKTDEIKRQNEELNHLIQMQKEKLQSINSRLQFYSRYQVTRSPRFTIDSLRRGEKPTDLTDSAPDQLLEQRMKIRLLSKELKSLVEKRVELKNSQKSQSLKARIAKRKHQAALKIQKVFRGFLTRRQLNNKTH